MSNTELTREEKQQAYDELTALIGWITDALEFLPMRDEKASNALDALLEAQQDMQRDLKPKATGPHVLKIGPTFQGMIDSLFID